MPEISELSREQYNIWDDFIKQISYTNRFFVSNHDFMKLLDLIIDAYKITIPKGTKFYRARKYTDDISFIEDHLKTVRDKSEQNISNEDKFYQQYRLLEESEKRSWAAREQTGYWGYDFKDSFVPSDSENVYDGRANPSRIINLYISNDPNAALAEVRPTLKSYVSMAEIDTLEDLIIIDLSFESLTKKKEKRS